MAVWGEKKGKIASCLKRTEFGCWECMASTTDTGNFDEGWGSSCGFLLRDSSRTT